MTETSVSFAGRRVTVMGLGGFGGGEGAARYLAERGARVTVTDLRTDAELSPALERLASLPIEYRLGRHEAGDFTDTDLVIVNPAVKPVSPYLSMARRAGVRLDTSMNLFLRACPARVLGVTGTNGKSTTTAMAEAMLRAAGLRTWLGGNLGGSLLPDLESMRPDHVAVLELSSFQLDRLAWNGRAPNVSVVLNVTPNHLDWHADLQAYAAAKRNIVSMQGDGDVAVLNAADPEVRRWEKECGGEVFWIDAPGDAESGARLSGPSLDLRRGGRTETVSLKELALPGPHNRLNAACAAAAAWLMGAPPLAIERALIEFRTLPHRLDTVATVEGVRFVEDSVSTTPEATIAALRSFHCRIHLIAGGSSKNTRFDAMGRAIAERADTAVLIGQTAGEIARSIESARPVRAVVCRASTLAEAFDRARGAASPGDVVMLSPGCASFDMFRNYEDRAAQFRELVRRLDLPGG